MRVAHRYQSVAYSELPFRADVASGLAVARHCNDGRARLGTDVQCHDCTSDRRGRCVQRQGVNALWQGWGLHRSCERLAAFFGGEGLVEALSGAASGLGEESPSEQPRRGDHGERRHLHYHARRHYRDVDHRPFEEEKRDDDHGRYLPHENLHVRLPFGSSASCEKRGDGVAQ